MELRADLIRSAYRLILRREPDREGLNAYIECLALGNMSMREILDELKSSDEFRNLTSKEETITENKKSWADKIDPSSIPGTKELKRLLS